jgi:hypothetical protein
MALRRTPFRWYDHPMRFPSDNPFPSHVFVDCEASGLHNGSYPIEVGWAGSDLVAHSLLIKPAPEWGEKDWDDASERIHKIPRSKLVAEGVPVGDVARRINEAFCGKQVHSDNPDFEKFWLGRIFRAAQVQPEFSLLTWQNACVEAMFEALGNVTFEDYTRVKDRIFAAWPHIHRGAEDSLAMAAMYRACARPGEMDLIIAEGRRRTAVRSAAEQLATL